MAVANEHMHAIFDGAHRPGRTEPVRQCRNTTGFADIHRAVHAELLDSLDVGPQESRLDIESAGQGESPTPAADVTVAGLDMTHFGNPAQVATELLQSCRPGGRIGLACPAPGSFLAEIHACIEAYTAPERRGQRRGFTGTRQVLDALFGASAIALGARDKSVILGFASVEHWLAEGQASHAPLRWAYERIDPVWRHQFTSDLLRIAGSYAQENDGKLSIRCDYLEFIVHKGSLQ